MTTLEQIKIWERSDKSLPSSRANEATLFTLAHTKAQPPEAMTLCIHEIEEVLRLRNAESGQRCRVIWGC